jgi:hypothetical protein
VSNEENWIINKVYLHVRIREKKPCPEKPNPFMEAEWKAKCASDPANSFYDEVVDGEAYKCFSGALEYGEAAVCSAETLLPFDPSKQTWDFFFNKVTGHPEDPIGIFR